MEYLTRVLLQLVNNPRFHYHSKCKKLKLISLTFVDDLLLFSRGDKDSVDLLLAQMAYFSRSTGLCVNRNKCFIYTGGVSDRDKETFRNLTKFIEGELPFRYLGVPLTSKKLAIKHCLVLIDKIIHKVTHWNSKLLTYAGRVQLIKSVVFSVVNFWMQVLRLPKVVLHHIDSICRSFLSTGGKDVSSKSPIAWNFFCRPMAYGGMNIMDLECWNKVCMLKLVWNVHKKADSLWIKWIHEYYLKHFDFLHMQVKDSQSWMMKHLLHSRLLYQEMHIHLTGTGGNFQSKKVYNALKVNEEKPVWRHLMFGNYARPRAVFILWLVCNGRLATKERLKKFGMISDDCCAFCLEKETTNHLFFYCAGLKEVWVKVLKWIHVNHTPLPWDSELDWIIRNRKGKSWRASLIKCAVTESIYTIWRMQNDKVFGHASYSGNIEKDIIDSLVYKSWNVKKYRNYIASLMV
ncbi:uncharacterized protein LOC131650488 [Vicia villosa]|uniref:uncharacterized protein LOC131650488 n=1 Tax=Vicia villosa TaxID=3911 RepID=UPI00273CA18F|nr:uncharacterized protein LOC131650488 [Vicia villosa]